MTPRTTPRSLPRPAPSSAPAAASLLGVRCVPSLPAPAGLDGGRPSPRGRQVARLRLVRLRHLSSAGRAGTMCAVPSWRWSWPPCSPPRRLAMGAEPLEARWGGGRQVPVATAGAGGRGGGGSVAAAAAVASRRRRDRRLPVGARPLQAAPSTTDLRRGGIGSGQKKKKAELSCPGWSLLPTHRSVAADAANIRCMRAAALALVWAVTLRPPSPAPNVGSGDLPRLWRSTPSTALGMVARGGGMRRGGRAAAPPSRSPAAARARQRLAGLPEP